MPAKIGEYSTERSIASVYNDMPAGYFPQIAVPKEELLSGSRLRMTFADAVRSGGVRGPQQRGYDEKRWRAAFDQIDNPAAEDQRLFASGLWFGRRFSSARSAWSELARLPYRPTELARLFVGVTNFQTSYFRPEIPERTGDEAAKFDAYSQFYREATEATEKLQHAIESLRIPLSNALAGNEPSGVPVPDLTPAEALFNGLLRRTALGQHYVGLERLWADCVWNDWYVDQSEDADAVRPSNVEREIWKAAAYFRRDSLLNERAHYVHGGWAKATIRQRRQWADVPVVTGVKRHAKRLVLSVGPTDVSSQHPPFPWVALVAASEEYLEGIGDEPLPELEGLTVRELLSAYWVLAPLGELLAEPALSLEVLESLNDIELCAPKIHIEDCVDALVRALGVSKTKGRAIVRVFTFDGSARDELWLKPLIPLGGEWVTTLFEPLRTPNLPWAVDWWLRRGGLDMSSRGPAFERQLRGDIAASAELAGVRVVPHSLKLSARGRQEEIDLVIRIGSTVVIGEAKCSVFPTEPYEFRSYERVLADGAAQASRKADFTRANFREFASLVGWDDLDESAPKVVPVVVTNLPFGAALPSPQASVTDYYILRRFLVEGSLPKFVEVMPDGSHTSAAEVMFYNSPAEAETAIESYLKYPPQLTELQQAVKVTARPLIYFPGEKPARYVAVYCDPFDIMRPHMIPELNGHGV